MNVHIPLWIVVLVAVAAYFGLWTRRGFKHPTHPEVGCIIGLSGTVVVLVVLLVHAWGWL